MSLQAQEPPRFERKSMELRCFQLLLVLEDMVLCHADLANHYLWFSISQKSTKMIFIYNIPVLDNTEYRCDVVFANYILCVLQAHCFSYIKIQIYSAMLRFASHFLSLTSVLTQ